MLLIDSAEGSVAKTVGNLHSTHLHATVGKLESFVEASVAGPPSGPVQISFGGSIATDDQFAVLTHELTALVSQFNSKQFDPKQAASRSVRPKADRPTEEITFSVAGVASTAGDVEDLKDRALEHIRAFESARHIKK
jgi:hypothetical protein